MEKTQTRLREQIQRHRANRSRPNLRYPTRLRQAIVTYTTGRLAGGSGLHAVARSLGLSPNTLYGWLGATGPRGGFRPVRVVASMAASPRAGATPQTAVVVTPQGYRVEGLAPEQLVGLLRALA
jgi:hypothetical protein